nr:MAG TPA: hypothetical protein [Caudoviricetes sp.]
MYRQESSRPGSTGRYGFRGSFRQRVGKQKSVFR